MKKSFKEQLDEIKDKVPKSLPSTKDNQAKTATSKASKENYSTVREQKPATNTTPTPSASKEKAKNKNSGNQKPPPRNEQQKDKRIPPTSDNKGNNRARSMTDKVKATSSVDSKGNSMPERDSKPRQSANEAVIMLRASSNAKNPKRCIFKDLRREPQSDTQFRSFSGETTSNSLSRTAPNHENQVDRVVPQAIKHEENREESPSSVNTEQLAELTPFKPCFDERCVLNMPEWSDIGRSLQHPEHSVGHSAPMPVRIGVDFGTAFTKVAIRAGFDLVPVEWSAVTGDVSEMGRYVVPGFVVRAPDNEFCWRCITAADIQGNLKLSSIEMAGTDKCPIATVAYLALVIRYARAFLYRNAEIGRKLAGRSLLWELNIGCPTEPHENPKVVDVFRRIAQTAWLLAAEDRLVEQDILAAWSLADSAIDLEAEPGVVPEFVAQIAGYLGSPQVQEGMHALIDIGAATLDVATFNVVLPNDQESLPRIPIFFSAVRPLGTHYLRLNRYSKLCLDLSWNDAAPVESADEFGQRYGKPLDEVVAVDEEFVGEVVRLIFGVINSTRTNARGDRRSAAWRDGLPIFVTGGGANCILYRQAIGLVEEEVRLLVEQRSDSSTHFRLIELNPTSGNARQIEASDRLTVALGLTEDAENIARVVPHRDIEPITYGTPERVDHTDLYGD